jgi:UDP-glucose 4-epimerase
MVLVTGASGMIGRAAARALAASGLAVRAHDRSALDFETATPAAYDALVSGCDAIVHCAALVHDRRAPAERYHALNVKPTATLLDAAAREGVHTFVLLSTSAVYGPGPFENAAEDREPCPATPYAESKLRCEQALAASPIARKVALRPALVFGEGDRGNMLSLISAIERGRYVDIRGNRAKKSLVCADDVAQACLRCLSLAEGSHVLNVANREPVGVLELSDAIAEMLGRHRPPALPHALLGAGARVMEVLLRDRSPLTGEKLRTLSTTTTCSIDRLAATTGFVPGVPLRTALAAEVRWARGR